MRTPKNYQGIKNPQKQIKDILENVFMKIDERYHNRFQSIVNEWKYIVGKQIAEMTVPFSFENGILLVKVKSSTLLSILNQEKDRLLQHLQKKFPKNGFRRIIFRIG